MTNAEKQRLFRERMYEKGFKQKTVWVKRNSKQKPAEELFLKFSRKFQTALFKEMLNSAKTALKTELKTAKTKAKTKTKT